MESIDKIKRLADIVSKNTAPSSNTNTLIGNLLKAMALYMAEQHHGAVGGYQFLNSIDDLPTGDLTDKQKRTGYVVGENIYFYVGTDGDTLDGEYQNGGSFHGTKGDDGLSAYEIWKAIPGNENYTLDDFWRYLTADKGYKKIPLASESARPAAGNAELDAIYIYPKTGDNTKSVTAVSDGHIWIVLFESDGSISEILEKIANFEKRLNAYTDGIGTDFYKEFDTAPTEYYSLGVGVKAGDIINVVANSSNYNVDNVFFWRICGREIACGPITEKQRFYSVGNKTWTADNDYAEIGFKAGQAWSDFTIKIQVNSARPSILDLSSKVNSNYVCDSAASVNKVIVSDWYRLINGSSFIIKFENENTKTSNVTLKVGDSEAKPLYYCDAPVSSENSWDIRETLRCIYDGEKYNLFPLNYGKELRKRALSNYIVGKGNDYSKVNIYSLVPQRKYRICFHNQGWSLNGVETSVTNKKLFAVISTDYGSKTTYLVDVPFPQTAVESSYDFVVPQGSKFVSFGGRASEGVNIEFTIIDITDTADINGKLGFVTESVYSANYILRKNTSSGTAVNDENGVRLRIVFEIGEKTSIDVSTIETSGLYCALFNTLYDAIYAKGELAIERYTEGYQQSCSAISSASGFLSISLTNGTTPITDERQQELLGSLSLKISTGFYAVIGNRGMEDDSVASLNKDMDGAIFSAAGVNSFKSGGYKNYTTEKKHLSILVISDIHGSFNALERAIAYSNEKLGYIDYNVCLGDVVQLSPIEDTENFDNAVDKSIRPFLFVMGNHDTADTDDDGITESEARTKYFSKIEEHNWIENFMDSGKCSWYKDDATYKIRFIGIFEYGNSQHIETGAPGSYCRRWIPTDTLQWFADTLYNTPSDYSVIVLLHQSLDLINTTAATSNSRFEECNFTVSSRIRRDLSQSTLNTVDGNPIGDIINAFINGSEINRTYNTTTSAQAAWNLNKTATVYKDFTNRGLGKFICYIVGHSHCSLILKGSDYPNQKTIAVPSGSQSAFQQHYGDINYENKGRNQDQFYVIGFNTDKGLINIVKIGGQVTNDMVKRDYISIPY